MVELIRRSTKSTSHLQEQPAHQTNSAKAKKLSSMAIGGSLHDSSSVASEEPSLISLVHRASMSSIHEDNSSNHNGTRTRRSEKQRRRTTSKKKKHAQENDGMQNRLQQLEDLIQRSMREMETLKDSESVKIQSHARGFLIRNRGLALVSQQWRETLYLMNIVKLQALVRGFLRRRRSVVEQQEAYIRSSNNNTHNNSHRETVDAGGSTALAGPAGKPKGPMKFVKSALSRIGSKRSGRRKQRKGRSNSCTEPSTAKNSMDTSSSRNNGMDRSSSRNGMDSSTSTREMDLSMDYSAGRYREMDFSRDRSGRYKDTDRSERSRYKDMDMSRSQNSLSENTTIGSQSVDEYVAELSTLPETDEFLSSPRTPKESKKPKFIKGALQKLNSMTKLGGDGDKKKENDNASGQKQKNIKKQSSITKLFSMKKSSNHGSRATSMKDAISGGTKDDTQAKMFGAPLSSDDQSESNEFMESSGNREEDDPALTTTRVHDTMGKIADDRRRRSIYSGDDDMNSSRDRSIQSVDAESKESKSKDGQKFRSHNIDTSYQSLQLLTESEGSNVGDDDIYGSSIEFSAANVDNLSAALLLREDEEEDNGDEFDILATGPQNGMMNSCDDEDAPENANSMAVAKSPKQSMRRISSQSYGSLEYRSIVSPTSTNGGAAASGPVTDDESSECESMPVIEIINLPDEMTDPSLRSFSGANHERLSKTSNQAAPDRRPRTRRLIIEMQYSSKRTRRTRREETRQQMDQLKKRLKKVDKLIRETNAEMQKVTEAEAIKIQAVARGYLQRNYNATREFRERMRGVRRLKSTDFSTAVLERGIKQREKGKATKSGDLTNMAIVIQKPVPQHRQSRISRKQKRAEKAAAQQAEQEALQERLKAIEALITQTAHDLELEMATITGNYETGEVVQATAEVDEDSAAIKIQSLVRCAFPRKKYRLQRLRKRLQLIGEEKKTEIEELKKRIKTEKEGFKKRAGKTSNIETRVKMVEFLKKEIQKEQDLSISLAGKVDSLKKSNVGLKKSNQSSLFAVGKVENEVKSKTAEKERIEKIVDKWKESLKEVEDRISVADKQAEMEQKLKASMTQCMRDIHVKLKQSGRHQKITEGIESLMKNVDV